MRTVITYLDKDKNRTTKEKAWTIVSQIYNDAGNLQRTGYTIGPAQSAAAAAADRSTDLQLMDADTKAVRRFTKNYVKVGRDEGCDLVVSIPDKKKIDKIHVSFERRENRWYAIDQSKSGVWLNGTRIASGVPVPVEAEDVIELAQRKKLIIV